MSLFLILCLIVSGSLVEIIVSSLNRIYGLLFALASFLLAQVDFVLIFLSFSLLALHFFYVSSRTLWDLRLTEEAQVRKSYLETMRLMEEIRLEKCLKQLS